MVAPKYAKTVDLNQSSIVEALRAIGCGVEIIGRPVDLLVGYRKRCFLIEIKREGMRPRKDQKDQQEWIRAWPGQVRICSTPLEAIRLVTGAYESS